MLLVKLYFHGKQELSEIEVPKTVEVVQDHGVQSIFVMDGPRKRFYGKVLTIKGEKITVDEWLKNNNEVYVDSYYER